MRFLFLALFALFSLIHLYYCFFNDRKGRIRTKPFLIITLFVFYLLSAQEISCLLAAALLASWTGDILLIGRGEKWLVAGGGFFIAAHVLLMLLFLRDVRTAGQPWAILAVILIIYVASAYLVIKSISDRAPKIIASALFMYLLINAMMNMFALMRMITLGTAGSALVFVGAVFFFLSDCALFILLYHRDPKIVYRRNFTVMVTYLLAEFLITVGNLIG